MLVVNHKSLKLSRKLMSLLYVAVTNDKDSSVDGRFSTAPLHLDIFQVKLDNLLPVKKVELRNKS